MLERDPDDPVEKDSGEAGTDAIAYFLSGSLQRHVIEFGEWMVSTSNQRAQARGHEALRPAHANLLVHLKLTGSRRSTSLESKVCRKPLLFNWSRNSRTSATSNAG
ncbi:MAG: hypothetical protein ABWY93_26220 [Mycobacterium sp.]